MAAADRGNYPLLTFEAPEGTADWFLSLVAIRGAECLYGWDGWAIQAQPGWTVVRSLKRLVEDAGPETSVDVDGARYPLMDLLTGMVEHMRRALSLPGPGMRSCHDCLGDPLIATHQAVAEKGTTCFVAAHLGPHGDGLR